MSETLERNLQDATRLFRQALDDEGRGENEAARTSLLQAAEKLYLAAADSRPALKESRMRLAQQLLAEAQRLEKLPARSLPARTTPATGGTPSSGPTSTAPVAVGPEGSEQAQSWLVREKPDLRFSDIAGLEEVKEQIRLKLLYPYTHPELAQRYGIQPGGGLLLYGPPGTGKTMIARAVAGEIEAAFFAIKPSEVMSQWVGVSEQNIAKLFEEANSYPRSVLFIDEIEALTPKRRVQASTVMARVVPQILAELDGFKKRQNALLLVGATNEPWAIDAAILRPGRLDRLIYVPPPDFMARKKILEINLKDVPLAEDLRLDEYAARTANYSGADMAALARRARERVFTEVVHQGLERPLGAEDFEAELSKMMPSIPAADLRLFEQFASGSEIKRR